MHPEIRRTSCLAAMITMVTLFTLTSCDIFTSSLKVQRMVLEEEKVLEEFKHYVDTQYDKLKSYSKFYNDRLEEVRSRQQAAIRADLKHPNAVFNVIKRFASDYYTVLGDNYYPFMDQVRSSLQEFLADGNDLKGARLSLLRLQTVYKMDPLDMIRGDYLGFKGPPLHPQDAYEIGQAAFTEGKLNDSVAWLNASLTVYASDEFRRTSRLHVGPSKGAIKALMGRVYLFNGERGIAEGLLDEAKKLDFYHGDVQELEKELASQQYFVAAEPDDTFHNFSRLCSLENRHYPAEPNNPKIVCRYREALLPYNRYKEELLSLDPYASVIYNVTTDAEAEHLKDFVKNKLVRGMIGGSTSGVSDLRTSDLAWIWDHDSPQARRVSLKVQHLTGLDVDNRLPDGPSSGEALQVVNYGLGGHYEVHMDPFDGAPPQPELKLSGERIATFLIYLSDVERGGSTVFTRAGIAVAPVKNMGLFWYSFNPAHQIDENTHHAGCPVLIGQKWIVNKWIWTYGNTFLRRCGLTPDATQLDIEPDMKRGYK